MRAIGWIPRFVMALAATLVATVAMTAATLAKPAVTDARLGVEPDLTRIVLNLSERTEYRIFTLADPYRVVIDLDEVDWKIGGTKLQGRGLVAAMRYGLFKAGTSRVVLDLIESSEVARAGLLPAENGEPPRLLIDLRPVAEGQFRAQLKTAVFASTDGGGGLDGTGTGTTLAALPAPAPSSAQSPDIGSRSSSGTGLPAVGVSGGGMSGGGMPANTAMSASAAPKLLPRLAPRNTTAITTAAGGGGAAKQLETEPKRAKPLIVIDPGHGGIDPGAVGDNVAEKQLTLAVAKALKKELEATGKFRVALTRSKDVYIPLRDRFSLAREKGADLFISLHADSHSDPTTRGASVYTLSEKASDAEAEALAAKENKSDIIAGVDLSKQSNVVTDILIDLAQRDTKNMSTRFASLLVKELKRETMLLGNTHRYAGFAVLKAPDVPSVLVEMGYISSSKDAALLSSDKHQKRLAKAIRGAIENYFSWQEMVRRS